jgi:hypothetical protein
MFNRRFFNYHKTNTTIISEQPNEKGMYKYNKEHYKYMYIYTYVYNLYRTVMFGCNLLHHNNRRLKPLTGI